MARPGLCVGGSAESMMLIGGGALLDAPQPIILVILCAVVVKLMGESGCCEYTNVWFFRKRQASVLPGDSTALLKSAEDVGRLGGVVTSTSCWTSFSF